MMFSGFKERGFFMKKIISAVLTLSLLCTGITAFADGPRGGQRGGGGVDKSGDTELQTMIADVAPKYQLMTYEEDGASLQYQLFVPENYDPDQSYPLIQFIPDSSVVGKGTDAVLTQGWGGLIWATESEQEKHPAFVVVPVFTETIVDDEFNHSSQIDLAMRMLEALTEEYSIDLARIYTTGQSMGGMTSFYLSTAYPDIVSAGDPKASAGQSGLLEVFDTDAASYTHGEWGAQDADQDEKVALMLSEGNDANFVTFTEGTALAEGQNAMMGAGEHMTSFDYAYKIEAVRDWLFAQTK